MVSKKNKKIEEKKVNKVNKKQEENLYDDCAEDHENDQLMGSVYDNFNLSQYKNPNFDDSDRNVSVKNFSITTSAGIVLFKDVDLNLTYGRRYGLVGPNGKGKTTLLRHIGLRQFQIPSILDVLYCEQEVFCDETPAVQMVLNADKNHV
ncbi:MAG: ATP-binding cassette sub- F member 1 [Marteilia pararefringens]